VLTFEFDCGRMISVKKLWRRQVWTGSLQRVGGWWKPMVFISRQITP